MRSLNARNRYKSDRDCERRRADIQRPFAMPGIERGVQSTEALRGVGE